MRALFNTGHRVSVATVQTLPDAAIRHFAAQTFVALVLLVFGAKAFAGPTLTTMSSSLNPSTVGASVTFSANVNWLAVGAGGTVNFTRNGLTIPGCGASILTGSGSTRTALCTTTTIPAGTHSIVGAYTGDANNSPSTSSSFMQDVTGGGGGPGPTSTALASSQNPAPAGASITFTANVTGTAPTGTVNFTNGAASISGCSASPLSGSGNTRSATCTTTTLPAGTHSIAASYAGDGANGPSTSSTLSQTVTLPATTTALASSLNPTAYGPSVTFTASVTGAAPTGTVAFRNNGNTISGCSARTLSGSGNTRTATCTASGLTVGFHGIVATYSGNASNAGSASAEFAQVVTLPGTTTTLASSLNPGASGASVTLTASVTGNAPTGTVNFVDGASSISGCSARTLSGSGNTRTATCTTSSLSVGVHTIVASYNGNATNAFSNSASHAQVVGTGLSATTLASSLNPAIVGASVTFTASVVGTAPTGTVTFHEGGTPVCGVVSLAGSGNTRTASCTTSVLGAGFHGVVASYSGNPGNSASTSSTLWQSVTNPPQQPPNFVDVPIGHVAYAAVRALAYNNITVGCASNPARFCPDGDVGRDEMAIFLERATRGLGFPFAPTGSLFSDVSMSHWAVGSIEQLFQDGITAGCGASPMRFCPDGVVTRAEMAIFLIRARHGANYNPGSASGQMFSDVPSNHWAAAWIEEFAALGYTGGCSWSPHNFCPGVAVSRAQMAMFLQRVFSLVSPP